MLARSSAAESEPELRRRRSRRSSHAVISLIWGERRVVVLNSLQTEIHLVTGASFIVLPGLRILGLCAFYRQHGAEIGWVPVT